MALKIKSSKVVQAWAEIDGVRVSLGDQAINAELYVKVNLVEASKESGVAHLLISANGSAQMQSQNFKINLDGKNFIAQAYDHLKTLPEFAGATDC
jgi:autotransporter translocation and assembly factor TamB